MRLDELLRFSRNAGIVSECGRYLATSTYTVDRQDAAHASSRFARSTTSRRDGGSRDGGSRRRVRACTAKLCVDRDEARKGDIALP